MRRTQKFLTILPIQFESTNQNNNNNNNKILAVTRASRDVILKKPRSSGDENGAAKTKKARNITNEKLH